MNRITIKNYLFFIIIIILSVACRNSKIAGHYSRQGKSPYDRNFIIQSFVGNERLDPILTDASFIELYANGEYMMNLHHFEQGEYKYKEDTLYLKRDTGLEWKIWFKPDEEYDIGHFKFHQSQKLFSLKKYKTSKSRKYPFSPSNNQWRTKSDKDLSKREHADKIIEQLKYYKRYIIWCNKVKKEIKIQKLPGPISIAAQGVKTNRLNGTNGWCFLFKNKDDCKESLKVARMAFNKEIKTIRYRKKPYKTYIHIIDQLIDNLEDAKKTF